MKGKNRLWGALALLALLAAWLVFAGPLFSWHGMKDWPALLFGVAAVGAAVGLLLGKKLLPAFAAGGYILGFFAGKLLEAFEAPGHSHLWLFWLAAVLLAIVLGIVAEVFLRHRKKDLP